MGGVGKTTLMAQINNKFLRLKERHDFQLVIWVVVSKDARMDNIQDDIGRKIGCKDEEWDVKSMDDKAMYICRVLQEKKFVLLLDHLWERVDLRMLGVPFPDWKKQCKVFFTTRSEIVCSKMEAQRKIKVDCLAWEQAWELFQRKVGGETLNSCSEILQLSEDVAKKCGGLPLALITIGRAMACKRTSEEWKYAVRLLKKSAAEFTGVGHEVFPPLKFGYESLANDRVKSCFLYCYLFPEDFHIERTQLVDLWIGESFLDGCESTDEAVCQGYDIIGSLVHACYDILWRLHHNSSEYVGTDYTVFFSLLKKEQKTYRKK